MGLFIIGGYFVCCFVMIVEMVVEFYMIIDLICYGISCFNVVGLIFGYSYDNVLDEVIQFVLYMFYFLYDFGLVYGVVCVIMLEKVEVLVLFECCIIECLFVFYFIGEIWFVGLSFKSDLCVLVLCLLIVELIEIGFEFWLVGCDVYCVLDLCIGLGCIVIVMGYYYLYWEVDGVDFSDDVLVLVVENKECFDVYNVILIKFDLFNGFIGCYYDLIVINFLYVINDEIDVLLLEYFYELEMGLCVGDDGLDLVLKIFCDVLLYFSEDGLLICEVGEFECYLIKLLFEVVFNWIEFKVGQMGIFVVECCEFIVYSICIIELVNV